MSIYNIAKRFSRFVFIVSLLTILPLQPIPAKSLNSDLDGPTNEAPNLPSVNTWSYTGNLNTARGFHTATLLTNVMVLVAGVSNTSGPLRTPSYTIH
jgi:hypothetical protein